MMTTIIFLLILTLLVVVHEWGHFAAARKFGMKVYEFGMGFPPRAFGVYKDPETKKWHFVSGKGKSNLADTVGGENREIKDEFPSTVYSFNWLPLGGFVKIKGENGEDAKDPDSFGAKKTWQKSIVLIAGVTMNFVLAAVLLGIGFGIGIPSHVGDGVEEGATLMGDARILIQQVQPDSPAAIAELNTGDEILSLNGVAYDNAADITAAIRAEGTEAIRLTVKNTEGFRELTVTPAIMGEDEPARIGVALADVGIVKYPWYTAIPKGIVAAWHNLMGIFVGFFLLFKGLLLGQGLAFDVSGPVGIASIVGESARMGVQYLIHITAMISLSLAAINILPIPALDGGRLLFVLIEGVFKKPVPLKYEQLAHTIGFLLLMGLIIVVTVRDVAGLF